MNRDDLEPLCDLIRDLFSRVFSAARAFMFFKLSSFVCAVGAISFGFIGQFGSSEGSIGGRIEISEPGVVQMVVTALLFVFAVAANIYVMNKSREHELRLEELKRQAPAPLRRRLTRRKR